MAGSHHDPFKKARRLTIVLRLCEDSCAILYVFPHMFTWYSHTAWVAKATLQTSHPFILREIRQMS